MSLPILAPTGAKIPQILSHMADCWPDDRERMNEYLRSRSRGEYTYAHQDVADALTEYCKANNLGSGVSEASVRRYRKAQR